MLFDVHAPDRYQPVTSKEAPPLHILIAGLSDFGAALLAQAARVGHYLNRKKLHVTIVDEDIEHKLAALEKQYPALQEIVVLNGQAAFPDLQNQEIPITAAYLCHNRFERSVADMALLSENEKLKIEIVVVQLDDTSVNVILADHPGFKDARVHPFYFSTQACSADAIFNQKQDAIARQYHEGYLAQQKKQGTDLAKRENTHPWPLLPENLKDSNRDLVDHLHVKLRALGITTKDQVPDTLSPEQLEPLAMMEHDRWMAERLLSGWKYAEVKDTVRKHSPYLVGWDELTEEIKEYDRIAVTETLNIYKAM